MSKQPDDCVDALLIARLMLFVDPFATLGIRRPHLHDLRDLSSADHVEDTHRRQDYHLPRIAHFVRALGEGVPVNPILVDNVCAGMHFTNIPRVVDGHHRLAAHILLDRDRVPAYFSGRLDVRDWLMGRLPEQPE